MDELKPCPWCGGIYVEAFPAHAASYAPSVLCHACGRAVDDEDAISAWNALPRAPQWVKYDGTQSTLPIILDHVLIESGEHRYLGRLTYLSTVGRPHWQVNDEEEPVFMCKAGDRWTPWPQSQGGE